MTSILIVFPFDVYSELYTRISLPYIQGNVVKTETPSRGLRRSARKTPKPVRGLDSRRCPVDVQGVVRVEDESMLTHQGLKSGEGEESRHPHPHPNYNPLQDDSLADHIPCPQQGTSAESRLPMKTCQELLSGQPLVGVLPPCLSLDEESAEGEGLRLPAAESPLPMSRHEVRAQATSMMIIQLAYVCCFLCGLSFAVCFLLLTVIFFIAFNLCAQFFRVQLCLCLLLMVSLPILSSC